MTVTSHARCRRRIKAPKSASFPVIVRRFPDVLNDRGWSEIVAGDVRNQFQVVARHNSGGNNGDEIGSKPRLSSSNRRRSSPFPTTRMAWIRSSSLKLRIGTKFARNGGRKWENQPVKVAGPGRVAGQTRVKLSSSLSRMPSLSPILSLSLNIYGTGCGVLHF